MKVEAGVMFMQTGPGCKQQEAVREALFPHHSQGNGLAHILISTSDLQHSDTIDFCC